jgi:hypothetical protein
MAYSFNIFEMKKGDIDNLNLTDVVKEVGATMICDHLGARRLKTVFLQIDPPSTAEGFTQFASLTESQVAQWVEDILGSETVNQMHLDLQAECEECVNPSNENVAEMPWFDMGDAAEDNSN